MFASRRTERQNPIWNQVGASESQFKAWRGDLKKILSTHLRFYYSKEGREHIERAFWFAVKNHEGMNQGRGQKRADGSPYITHPIATALLAAEFGSDAQTVAGCLLHDVIEDCNVRHAEIKELFKKSEDGNGGKFGAQVSKMVGLMSKPKKIGKEWVYSQDGRYFETAGDEVPKGERTRRLYRRLHNSGNARATIGKLFDNMHNMETITAVDEEKRGPQIEASMSHNLRLAEIVSPLAHQYLSRAINTGLTSIGWTQEQIKQEMQKYRQDVDYVDNRRFISLNHYTWFCPKYLYNIRFRNHEDEKHIFVYHAKKSRALGGGEKFLRVPRVQLRHTLFRSKLVQNALGSKALSFAAPLVAITREKAERKTIQQVKRKLEAQGVHVEEEENPFPILFRRAYLYKLTPESKRLGRQKLLEKLEQAEKKIIPITAPLATSLRGLEK